MTPAQREELWQAHDALEAVAKHLGVDIEALIEDPSVAVRGRAAALEVAARLDRVADVRAASVLLGEPASGAAIVYELRSFARELREALS